MSRLKKGTIKYFVLAFSAAFLALAMMAVSAAFLVNPFTPAGQTPKENQAPYLPRKEDGLNILLFGVQKDSPFPNTCMLVRFAPEKGQVPILTLPGKTAVEWGGKTQLLGEVYQHTGPRTAADALGESLGIPIQRYGVVTLNNLEKLVQLVGNVEYTVPYNVSYTKGQMRLEIARGRQLMDGSQVTELVTAQNYPGGELMRCALVSDLAASAINQHLRLACSQTADALFKAAINLVETDADYLDYESRKRALVFMAELKDKPASSFPLSGQFNQAGNTFTIDRSSCELIQSVYGGERTQPQIKDALSQRGQ